MRQPLAMLLIACLAAVSLSVPPATADDLAFKKHVISNETDYSAAALIDVNHDGQLDIVCGGEWYEAPRWKKHVAAKVPRIGGRPDGFSHLPFDVNRDGWVDVITVNYRSRSIKWMENPGEAGGAWTLHLVDQPGPMETGRLVDVDGDGQLDLLPNGRDFAAWWEFRWQAKIGKSLPAWIRHDLPKQAQGHGLGFGDIDGDGHQDIVGQRGWLKAPPDARAGEWRWYPEFTIERGSVPMWIVDPDEDGDNDIVWCSAHGFGVYWLEQSTDADGKRAWHRHAIDTSWSQGHAPLWADLDGDGRGELIAGKRYMSHGGSDPGAYDPMAVFRYQYDPAKKAWDRWTVSFGQRVSMGLDPKLGDIDNDGDLDLLASGRSGLVWLENLGPRPAQSAVEKSTYRRGQALLEITDASGNAHRIENAEAWGRRRAEIESTLARTGPDFRSDNRVQLEVAIERKGGTAEVSFHTRWIRYKIDSQRAAKATLYMPQQTKLAATTGVVCALQDTSDTRPHAIVTQLVARGYICLVPQLVAPRDIEQQQRSSVFVDHAWQIARAADVLQSLPEIDAERLAFVGDQESGELGLYAAALDQRLVATAIDAGSATISPAGATADGHRLAELMALVAPRRLRIALPKDDEVASHWTTGVKQAAQVYDLRKASKRFVVATSATDEQVGLARWIQRTLPARD